MELLHWSFRQSYFFSKFCNACSVGTHYHIPFMGIACCLVAKSRPTLLWLHGQLWPTRLLRPRNVPGKNAGVGCHFLLQGIVPSQGWNTCLLHRQVDSLPVSHLWSKWRHGDGENYRRWGKHVLWWWNSKKKIKHEMYVEVILILVEFLGHKYPAHLMLALWIMRLERSIE